MEPIASEPYALYFAHAVNMYNTPLEEAIVRFLNRSCPSYIIENPNQLKHQEGYRVWKERTQKDRNTHGGMNYFFDEVLPFCFGCVAMPFLDNRMGLGVAGEAKWFIERKLPVWIIEATRKPTSELFELFIDDRCNLFSLRSLTSMEAGDILRDEPRIVVPHEETRLRTWVVYNKVRRPFETAHLVSMPIPSGFYPE